MAKHGTGTVRIIPADVFHHFHQVNRYRTPDPVPADWQLPRRRPENATVIVSYVPTEIQEPGRHRYDETVHYVDPYAVFRITSEYGEITGFSGRIGKFECPREWVDGIAVEFEYL